MEQCWRFGVTMILLVGLVACGQSSAVDTGSGAEAPSPAASATASGAAQSHGGPVTDHVSLVDHLRGRGLTVEIAGAVQQPFLRPPGTLLRLSGGDLQAPTDVQSYNYDDTDLGTDGMQAAEADASQLGPDGSPPTMMITWVAPPHFFRKDRVIVLYTGTDQAVITVLTEALGPQFAGA